jgi:hypothetical protein
MASAKRFGYKVDLKQSFTSGVTKKCVDAKIGHTPTRVRYPGSPQTKELM